MRTALSALLLLPSVAFAQKEALKAAVEQRADIDWQLARSIWEWAEPGYQETKSSAGIAKALQDAGFRVTRGVAGIPTAFTAEFGSGKPVIAILGEYDALPEMSQEAVPLRQPRREGAYGHACGHHLFGVASMTASIVIREQIQAGKIRGTIRYYGCPAEEGGAAKAFMVRAGLFNDCDVALHWHPAAQNAAGGGTCLARIAGKFRFYGTAVHASGTPDKGRSALDAVLLTCHAAELLREHVPDLTRIHYTITAGGGAPNVVPEFAEVFMYARHPKADVVAKIWPRLKKCAEAGALATETRLEIVPLGGTREILPNEYLGQIAKKNLTALNDLRYDAEELKFAVRIQETFAEKVPLDSIAQVRDNTRSQGMGSSDVGDVSWAVPTVGMSVATWVPGTSAHSWQAVAAGGTTIGKKGMLLAAKALAATAFDLFTTPSAIEAARAEWQSRTNSQPYQSLMEKDQQPPLDYRNAPRRGSSTD